MPVDITMTSNPLVSAIIPSYNRARVVCDAIESALSQTYHHMEVIVVDDGSTDDTQAALDRFGDRIRRITQKNAGPSAARNHGVAIARGEFVAFLDSDDLWLPPKIERQVAVLLTAGYNVPCCLCNILMQWSGGKEIASFDIACLHPKIEVGICRNIAEVIATRFVLINQGIMVRRSVFDKLGGFNEDLRVLEDHEFALRLSLQGPWAFIRNPLVLWRQTATESLYQNAMDNDVVWRERWMDVLQEHIERVMVDQTHQRDLLMSHLRRELKYSRRALRIAQLRRKAFPGASAIGHLYDIGERIGGAILRRSPLFPRMSVEPLVNHQLW